MRLLYLIIFIVFHIQDFLSELMMILNWEILLNGREEEEYVAQ